MEKETFEGTVVTSIDFLYLVHEKGKSYPLDWLVQRLNALRGRRVKVTVTVEEINLRSRIEQEFNEVIDEWRGTQASSMLAALKQNILAELDKKAAPK